MRDVTSYMATATLKMAIETIENFASVGDIGYVTIHTIALRAVLNEYKMRGLVNQTTYNEYYNKIIGYCKAFNFSI